MKLARDRFEAVGSPTCGGRFLGLAGRAGIDARSQQGARFIAFLARLLQAGVGVGAHGEQLLLAPEPVLQAPPLPTFWRDFKVEPPPVKNSYRLDAWLNLPDRQVRECFGSHAWG